MRHLARMGGAAVVAALIAWLWLAPSASERRFATLESLYKARQLRQLEGEDQIRFPSEIQAIAAAAGIETPLDIGSAPQRGHLHFYLTDSDLAWFTNCSRGNAVYDSDLDAVFLDRTLWNPVELPKVGQSWPFTQQDHVFGFSSTFVDFVLLHELGHRQLHRSRWNLFDSVSSQHGRRQEIEADSFAVSALQSGYAKGLFGRSDGVVEELAELGISPNLELRTRAVVALLYSTSQMSIGLLFSRGSFSSLFTDQSHPSFGERVARISEVVSDMASSDPNLQPYFTYFRRLTERVEQTRRHHFVELHMEYPIEAAQFDDHGLTIIDTAWRMWHVDSSKLHDQTMAVVPERIGQIPIANAQTYVAAVWSLPSGEIFVQGMDGSLFGWTGSSFIKPTDPIVTQGGSSSVTISSVQPSTETVRTDGSTFLVTEGDRTIRSFRLADILSSTTGVPIPYDMGSFDSTLADGLLHIPLRKHLGPIAGCFELQISNPAAAHFVPLELDEQVDGFGQLIAVRDGAEFRHFLTGKKHSALSVWELFSSKAPVLRGAHATFASELPETIPESLRGQIEPYVTHARLLPAGRILISLAADSIYEFDVKSYRLDVLFHPSTSVNILLGRGGSLGLYAVNGYKAFVQVEP